MSMEFIERMAAKSAFLIGFNVALVAMFFLAGLDSANIFISIVTAELVLVGLGGARRSQIATQAKLDELIASSDKARNELTHIEEADEEDIQEKRVKNVERP